jgi:hypothetical protein
MNRNRGLIERAAGRLKRTRVADSAAGRLAIDVMLFPSDWWKARQTYRELFGRSPRILRPRTLNDKLQHSKLFRRKALYTQFADKIEVRDYVRDRVGEDVLTKLYWVGTDLADARDVTLPDRFVIKANQSSGGNLFVRDRSTFDWDHARGVTSHWLTRDHSVYFGEWEYRWVRPRLMIEEMLDAPDGDTPMDYKFFCFHGRVEMVDLHLSRYVSHTRLLCDRDFRRLPIDSQVPTHPTDVPKPPHYESMVEIAERLSAGEPFLRVDLYDVGRPIFGELTLHPNGGRLQFRPEEWDARLGALW